MADNNGKEQSNASSSNNNAPSSPRIDNNPRPPLPTHLERSANTDGAVTRVSGMPGKERK